MSRLRQSYQLLGVPHCATPLQVRQAYRDLVRAWHPDLFPHDPAMQARAQEKLKTINEAYRLVQEHLASRKGAPQSQAETLDATPPPVPKRPASPAVQTVSSSPWSVRPTPPLFPFFTAWENVPFMLLVAGVLYFMNLGYANLASGAGYGLRMLTLPLAFSLACNSGFRGGVLLRRGYLAVTLLFAGLLLKDAIVFSADLERSSQYRSLTPQEEGGRGSWGSEPAPSYSPFTPPSGGSPTGPRSPSSPYVPSPSAPLPPSEPSSPVAPAPLGR